METSHGTNYGRRVYVALWFACAGGITGILVVMFGLVAVRYDFKPSRLIFLLLIVVPSLLAGVSGFWIGADILNPYKTKTVWQAGIRGLFVAMAAWFAFGVFWSGLNALTDSDGDFFKMLYATLVVGSLAFGWLVAIMGVATGRLLFQRNV